jgi:hypothetical protein
MIHGQNLSSISGEPEFDAQYGTSLKFHPPACMVWNNYERRHLKYACFLTKNSILLPISCGGRSWERVDLLTIDWIPASVFTTVATYTSQS